MRHAHAMGGPSVSRVLWVLGHVPPSPQGSDGLHIVGWEHAGVPCALHSAIHPAIIYLLHIDDGVAILEGDLIFISCIVVIDSTEPLLGVGRNESATHQKLQHSYSHQGAAAPWGATRSF